MKKSIIMTMVALIAATTFVGCNLNEGQVKTIAQTSGTAAAVAFIAKENPDRATMDLIVGTMDIVQSNLTAISTNTTYTEVLYPVIVEFARSDAVPDQYEPLVLAGGISTLQAIDIFFVIYPEWRAKEELTREVANCFIIGAKAGFSLADNDPMLVDARKVAKARAKVFSQ